MHSEYTLTPSLINYHKLVDAKSTLPLSFDQLYPDDVNYIKV